VQFINARPTTFSVMVSWVLNSAITTAVGFCQSGAAIGWARSHVVTTLDVRSSLKVSVVMVFLVAMVTAGVLCILCRRLAVAVDQSLRRATASVLLPAETQRNSINKLVIFTRKKSKFCLQGAHPPPQIPSTLWRGHPTLHPTSQMPPYHVYTIAIGY